MIKYVSTRCGARLADGAGRGARRISPAPMRAIPANACGIPLQPPAALPPANSRSRRLADRAVLREAGQRHADRAADLSVLHADSAAAQPALGRRLGDLRRQRRAAHARGLHAPVEHQLPRQPFDRDRGLHLLERRDRQDPHLQHGGAAAGQDRRPTSIPRSSKTPRSTRSSRNWAPRSASTRSSIAALLKKVERDRPRHDAGKGLPVRRGAPTKSRSCRAGRSWST